jgi:hypothetical protein
MPSTPIECPNCRSGMRRLKVRFRTAFRCPTCGTLLKTDPRYYRLAKIVGALISACLAALFIRHQTLFVISIALYPFLVSSVAMVLRFRINPKILLVDKPAAMRSNMVV